jgi:hypothetical protein
MSVLFSTEVGSYLVEARQREPGGISDLVSALEKLNEDGEKTLDNIPYKRIGDDVYFLNIAGFIVTMIKRPTGDFHVTDVTKGVLADEIVRKAG